MASEAGTGSGGKGAGALRLLLGGGGGAALLGLGAFLVATRAEVTPAHLFALAGGGGALAVALAGARLRAVPGAVVGILAALAGFLAITWSYRVVSFPYVDAVRPWGMDWGPYPVLRPPFLLLVLLAVLPAALGALPTERAGRRIRAAARVLAGLACVGVVAFWAVPRWYEMDLIAQEGVVPNLPDYLPRPGKVGAGDTPAVIGGKLVRLHWSEYSFRETPARAILYVVHKELALASLAHGMHWSLADMKVASGGLTAASAATQATVRAALWRAQSGVSAGWLYLQLAALPGMVFLAFRLAWGRPLEPWLLGGARGLLRALLYGVPVVNLLLLVAMWATRLPDVGAGGVHVLVESAGLLACAAVMDLAGRRIAGEVARG